MDKIPFNKTHVTGNELKYIAEVISSGKISGDGAFTKRCQRFLENRYGFRKCLLTTSCTDALEMAAILFNIRTGDEVIVPSYTFVSTANAFVLRGAKIMFADSETNTPNIAAKEIEALISPRTKAIVVVHYGGIACEMDEIMAIAQKYNLFVLEDAAQAIDAYYKGRPLGSIGHLSAFSFHETKNIISGEGGMLAINDERFLERAEIIRDKGTNRGKFSRGEVDKYEWTDVGSSYLPSELVAAFLYAQLEKIEVIQACRQNVWAQYYKGLQPLSDKGFFRCILTSNEKTQNANTFCIVTKSELERSCLIDLLKEHGVIAAFHYLSLHKSPFFVNQHGNRDLPNADKYSTRLLRLPFFAEMSSEEVNEVIRLVVYFYTKDSQNHS